MGNTTRDWDGNLLLPERVGRAWRPRPAGSNTLALRKSAPPAGEGRRRGGGAGLVSLGRRRAVLDDWAEPK